MERRGHYRKYPWFQDTDHSYTYAVLYHAERTADERANRWQKNTEYKSDKPRWWRTNAGANNAPLVPAVL